MKYLVTLKRDYIHHLLLFQKTNSSVKKDYINLTRGISSRALPVYYQVAFSRFANQPWNIIFFFLVLFCLLILLNESTSLFKFRSWISSKSEIRLVCQSYDWNLQEDLHFGQQGQNAGGVPVCLETESFYFGKLQFLFLRFLTDWKEPTLIIEATCFT